MSGLGRIAATAVLDINPFEQSTRVLETRIRSVDRAMAAQETSIKNSGRSINGLKANYNLTGKSLETHTEILRQQKQKYEELTAGIKDVNQATIAQKTDVLAAEAAMNKTAGKIEELTGKYNSLGREIAIQDSNWTKVGNGLESVGSKMTSVGDGMTNFGNKWSVGVTAPIVAGVAASVKASIDFESAFAGTKKTVDELVDANGNVIISYDDLAKGIRDMAKELPASATEISEVAEAAGQLGIKTDNVLSFSKTMIDLGESTNMSAEEAATALARLANITGMPQTEFDKLGSVIVDLGNNFATTESEITAMGLRLAGAGSQVGMSESQIMAFAAALSSVGVEAEAGGSAFSKVMVQMQLAVEKGTGAFSEVEEIANRAGLSIGEFGEIVLKGGKDAKQLADSLGMDASSLKKMYKEADKSKTSLENFSTVAGMSGEQFSKAFKEDAAGAIIKFIEGLSHAEEKGTSAIKVLDDMEIKEVRLRDSLLRAAGASGVFTDAIEMGSKAWDSNTALTDEASKRYETTESKLKMLKNQINDVAIEFGGPFVDALRDGLTAVMPLIENIGKLAKSFSDADPETQKMIVNTLALTAAIGPASSIIGKFLKIGGGGISTLGSLAKHLGVVSGKAKASKTAFELTSEGLLKMVGGSTAAEAGLAGVATKTAGMTSALGLLNPWVLGTVAVVGTGVAVWKLWGEEAYNSAKRTERWGVDVGAATDKTLTNIQNFSQTAIGEFSLIEQGLSGNTDSMVDNFQKMGSAIENDLTKQIDAFKESMALLPEEIRMMGETVVQEAIDEREKALKIVEENNNRVSEIRKQATDNHRSATIEEGKIISDLMRQSAVEYVSITSKNADEQKKIVDALTGNIENATEKQATAWLQSLGKQRQSIKADYSNRLDEYKAFLDEQGILNTVQGERLIKLFEQARDDSSNALDQQMTMILEKYPELTDKVLLANGQLASSMGDQAGAVSGANKQIVDSVKDMTSIISESATKNAEKLGMLGDEGNAAGKKWNDIVLDRKTGEVKTNAVEEVAKATKSKAEWDELAYSAKKADLSSNAKLVIAEAAIANGHWWTMDWKEKSAMIDSNATQVIIQALQEKGIWDSLSFEQHKAILYSDTPEKVAQAVSDLGLWDQLSPTVKSLKADNFEFLNIISGSQESLNNYNTVYADLKKLLADDSGATPTIEQAKKAIEQFNELPEKLKVLLANNDDAMSKVTNAQKVIDTYNMTELPDKRIDITADTSGADLAFNSINSIPDNNEKRVTVVYDDSFIGPRLPGYEKGTNYHPGGGMVINDQKGSLYEELVQFPGQMPFTIKGRDVVIPNAPRGAKVWTAKQTKDILPHYAGGVGLNLADTKISQVMSRVKLPNEGRIINNNFDQGLSNKLDKLILLLTNNFGNNANTTRYGKAFEGAVFNLYGAQDARELSHELAWIAGIEGRGRKCERCGFI